MSPANRHEIQRQLSHSELRKAQRQATAFSSVIISLMMTLAAYGFSNVANAYEWPISIVVFTSFIFFAALETLYAKEIEKRILDDFGKSGFFRIAEIILLAVLLRIAYLLFGSTDAQWLAFIQNLSEPMAAWFVPEYTLSLFMLVILWVFILFTYSDMTFLYNLEDFTDWDQIGKQQANLARKRTTFLNRFILLGIMVLLAMIFSNGFLAQDGGIQFTFNGNSAGLIIVVMGYFLLLLLLMSQTQLARLRTRWWLNNSAVNPRVQRDWMRVSLIFFAVTALITLLSPTGFAESVFEVLQFALLFLMMIVQLFFALIFAPISIMLGWLFPFQAQPEGDEIPAEISQSLEDTAQQITSQPPAWLDTAADIVVWVLLGGVIVFALAQYMRQDRSLAADIASLFRRIRDFLRGAWASLRGSMEELSENIQRRRRLRRAEQTDGGAANVREAEDEEKRLGIPRKEIFRVYRRLLERGRQIGRGRKASQTPLDYEQTLSGELAEASADSLHNVTEAFDDARYSKRELTQSEADRMADEFKAVRRGMKKKE